MKLDEGTLNPDAVGGLGNTWNWAYNEASQFSPTANTLAFHQQGDIGYTTLRSVPIASDDDLTGVGVRLLVGYKVWEDAKWRVDLAVGFQGIWGADSRMSQSSYRERTSRLNVTDTYNVAETVDPNTGFPGPQTAPGGYIGQYAVPGPVITNVPSRSSQRTDLSTAENRVDFRFETSFYEITFNPRITYLASPTLSLSLTPSLGVGFIQVTADRTEVFTETTAGGSTTILGTWHDHRTECAVRLAAGLTAGAAMELGDGYYAGAFGGYEWAVDAVRLTIGPNSASVNGSGFVAGAVLGKRF